LRCRRLPGFERVDWRGHVPPSEVLEILLEARIGICIFHPTVSNIEGLSTKIFEYMYAGLPVVLSDFPGFKTIVEEANCGVVVDPLDCAEVAGAIEWLLDNPAEAEAMGRRGRQAVDDKYTWEAEEDKLISLYRRILGPPANQIRQEHT